MSESVVIQTSFLGDTVLTTPLVAELARRGPVDVVVTPAAAGVLANNPDIRELIVYDKRGRDAGLRGLRAVARRLRERGALRHAATHRAAYLAQGSVRSAAIAALAGIGERVGFDTSPGRVLYTRRVPYARDRHHAERLWRLAFPGARRPEPPPGALRPRLFPGPADVSAVDALLAGDARAPATSPLLVLAPGSVWGTKRWPYYAELATRLASAACLAIVGSAADREAAAAIAAALPSAERVRVVDATGQLSLLASAELIRRAAVLVTNDSSPQHLASAMGTPTITLFGPTVPAFGFGPLAPGSMSLGMSTLDCRPCHHHGPPVCPLGHWRCMRELAVGTVLDEVQRIIAHAAAARRLDAGPSHAPAPDRFTP